MKERKQKIDRTYCGDGTAGGRKTDNRKNRIQGERLRPDAARLAIVTGSHGDELEGQYICYETARRLKEGLQFLSGTVDIYPALNPPGNRCGTKNLPSGKCGYEPRIPPVPPTEPCWNRPPPVLWEDLEGADLCLDIHASDVFVREIPRYA